MTKPEELSNYIDYLVENCRVPTEIPPTVKEYLDSLIQSSVSNKPILTEAGCEILEYLQSLKDPNNLKAKDIADGMGISSRKISGSIRKLVADNFVEKFGTNPVMYTLTEKGKEFDIINFKETIKNGKEAS